MRDARTVIEDTIIFHPSFKAATQRVQRCFEYSGLVKRPPCVVICEESHCGKSEILEDLKIRNPSYRTEESLIMPVAMITTPSKPTVKGLTELLLDELGDPASARGTQQSQTKTIKKLVKQMKTKTILFDEFQHFVSKKSLKVDAEVADWFKVLLHDTKLSIVVAGLPRCEAVFHLSEGQLDGRFEAPVRIPRFSWEKENSRMEFFGVLKKFEEAMKAYFDFPNFTSSEMAFRFYVASGGLIGYLVNLLNSIVWSAIDENRKVIELSHMRRNLRQSCWHFQSDLADIDPFGDRFSFKLSKSLASSISNIGT